MDRTLQDRYTFSEKAVTSPLVFNNKGACSVKQNILLLSNSGYRKEGTKEILQSGIRRYYRLVLQEVADSRALYKLPEEMAPTRKVKDLKSKA